MLELKASDIKKLGQETLVKILSDAAKEDLPIFNELLKVESPLKVVKREDVGVQCSGSMEIFEIVSNRNNASDIELLLNKMHHDFIGERTTQKECVLKLDTVLFKLLHSQKLDSLNRLLDFYSTLKQERNKVVIDGETLNYFTKVSADTIYMRNLGWTGTLFNALITFSEPEHIKKCLPLIQETSLFGSYYDSSNFSKGLEALKEIVAARKNGNPASSEYVEEHERSLKSILNYFTAKGFSALSVEEKTNVLSVLGIPVESPKIEQILFTVNPEAQEQIKENLGEQILKQCFIPNGQSFSVNAAFDRWKEVGATASYGYLDIIENFTKKSEHILTSDEREFKRRILKLITVDGEQSVKKNKLTFLQSYLHKETSPDVFIQLRKILEGIRPGLFLQCVEAKSLIPAEFKSRKQTDFLGYCAIVGNISVATWLLKEYPKYPKTEARNLSKYLAKKQNDGSKGVTSVGQNNKVISNFEALLLEHKIKVQNEMEEVEVPVVKKSFRL